MSIGSTPRNVYKLKSQAKKNIDSLTQNRKKLGKKSLLFGYCKIFFYYIAFDPIFAEM